VLFHDPWAARDDYIDLLLRPDEASVAEAFFGKHLRAQPDHAHRVAARKLLEAQRNAMAMYTSCGWFFADVTGIETVQCIRYAARCVHLMQEFTDEDLEGRLMAGLGAARSNLGSQTGATVYRDWVLPEMRTRRRVANTHAIYRLLELESDARVMYGYTLRDGEVESFDLLGHRARRGHLWLRNRATSEETEVSYLALEYSPRNLRCFLAVADAEEHVRLHHAVEGLRPPLERADLERSLAAIYGGPPLGIGDLLADERRRIAERLAAGRVAGLRQVFRGIFRDNRHLLEDFADMQLDLPEEIRVPCEFTLQADLEEAASHLQPPFAAEAIEPLLALCAAARRLELHVDLLPVAETASQHLRTAMRALQDDNDPAHFVAAVNLLDAAEKLGFVLRRAESEELLHEYLHRCVVPQLEHGMPDPDRIAALDAALRFAERLNFVVDPWRAKLQTPAPAR
jgi:hypothetical protein